MLEHSYTKDIHDKKVLIVGRYPPPYGGVMVHIKRVQQNLEKQNNKVAIFDTTPKKHNGLLVFAYLLKALFVHKPDIIFFHEPTMSRLRLFSIVLFKSLFRYKLTAIDHNCRVLYTYSERNKSLFRFLIKKCDNVVVIGNTTEKCYVDNKVNKIRSIESPYLPPDLSDDQVIFKRYPETVRNFISSHKPLISANAGCPSFVNGKDLYGIDTCVELINTLKNKYQNVGLILGIGSEGTPEQAKYLEQIREKIIALSLENHICLFINKDEFWPITKRSDIFIRPTLSDSFGISVQEALDCGITAIASDVCNRPSGTILYTSNEQLFSQCQKICEK